MEREGGAEDGEEEERLTEMRDNERETDSERLRGRERRRGGGICERDVYYRPAPGHTLKIIDMQIKLQPIHY